MRRKNSSVHQLRQRIPRDVLTKARGITVSIPIGDDIVTKRIGPKADVVLASLRTRDPQEAKIRQADALAYLEQVWKGLRGGQVSLSHRQVVALAGILYRSVVDENSDEPHSAEMWRNAAEITRRSMNDPAAFERWVGPSADQLLAGKALQADAASRARLLQEVAKAFIEGAERLERNAEGDYRPDPNSERFPEWQAVQVGPKQRGSVDAPTFDDLLTGWWAEAEAGGLTQSTHDAYSSAVSKLKTFLKHDEPRRVTKNDIIAFKEARQKEINPRTGQPISLKTIKGSDLAGLKAIFRWAKDNGRVADNPAAEVTVRAKKPTRTRPKEFSDDEANAILKAALHYKASPSERPETAAAKRWVPWLCAYTGARVGEMTQLRKQDVRKQEGVWTVSITPEAGDVKDKEWRDVPLHPHLIEQGFIKFVEKSDGYLFQRVRKGAKAKARGGVANRLREWLRPIVPDTRVAPNHGWRHRFITLSRKHGVDTEIRRMITGHAGEGTDEQVYGEPAGLFREICKLPRYEV
jgi:integrase